MFGYIRPLKPELLVREYESYRAVYCSVCKVLGKRYGVFWRLALSYDSTFYAMLLFSLHGVCPGFEQKHCVANPLKKCVFCKNGLPQLQQAAALSVLLTVSKLQDDRMDHGKGKVLASFLIPLAGRSYRKAASDYPWMEVEVRRCVEQQMKAESQPDVDLDTCAAPSAEMLARILEHESSGGSPISQTRVLRESGYYLGRWVYLMDAADDMERDTKSGDFNWFVKHFGLTQQSTDEEWSTAREQANGSLNLTMSRLCAAFNLLDLQSYSTILHNVIEKGLPDRQKQLLFKKEKK